MHNSNMARSHSGFSLIELLVVLVILSLLGGIVAPRVLKHLSQAKSDTAALQIEDLSAALDVYMLETGKYPTTDQGLSALIDAPDLHGAGLPLLEIGLYVVPVSQVVTDDRVDIGQIQRGVLIDDLFCRGSLVEGHDDTIERHPCLADMNHPVLVSSERDKPGGGFWLHRKATKMATTIGSVMLS